MSKIIDAGLYFAEKVRYKPREITINEIVFPVIPLTDDYMELVEAGKSYAEMLEVAVEYGMASEGVRIAESPEMEEYYDGFWEKVKAEHDLDGDTSVIHQLGDFICEISKLSEMVEAVDLKEKAKAEEAKAHLEAEDLEVGDHMIPADTDVSNMTPEQMAQHHKNNAAA